MEFTVIDAQRPQLIVVTGRPAAGKTTFAKWLAKELRLPLISKDNIREVLFDQLGWKDRAWAQMLGRASVDLMFYFAQAQLEAGYSIILDNAFHPASSTPRFQALKTQYNVGSIQIICNSDRETLFQRFRARAKSGGRHPGHGDENVLDELRTNLASEHSPILEIGGLVIEVDTTDFARIDYQAILNRVRRLLEK
jgi:predicted kinase